MTSWYPPPKNRFLFSGKNKKIISKCCMLNFVSADILKHFHIFPRKQNLTCHANCLQISNVYWKKINIINMLSAENVQSANHQFSADDIFSSPELCSGWAIVITFRPSSVRPSVNIFKRLLLWSRWVNFAQISYGASLGWGNEKLLKWLRSIDQDGCHAHIW